METRANPSDLQQVNLELAIETSLAAIGFAVDGFGSELCVLSSMQDAVLIDLALRVNPSIEIVFLDNGYHFAETWDTVHRVQQRYGTKVTSVGPLSAPRSDIKPGACCDLKLVLLDEALRGKRAWLSGIRRSETTARAGAELVEVDRRGLTKINPLVAWTGADTEAYIRTHDVPTNALLSAGYSSIGCAPCTVQAAGGRDGRWAGLDRTECGLHL